MNGSFYIGLQSDLDISTLHRRRSTLKLGGVKKNYEGRRLFSIEGGL